MRKAFDRKALREALLMPESKFADRYGLTTVRVPQRKPADFYLFGDNGASKRDGALFVAHLDTVARKRTCAFSETAAGLICHSTALDDRLGAYIGLHLLPALGIATDILLTTGEETGESTAAFFETAGRYGHIIEFDRGGTDAVLYQYETPAMRDLLETAGWDVGLGSFSDVSYLEHLETVAFNVAAGYRDYHGPRAHAWLEDTFASVAKYLDLHALIDGEHLPHFPHKAEILDGCRCIGSSMCRWCSDWPSTDKEYARWLAENA